MKRLKFLKSALAAFALVGAVNAQAVQSVNLEATVTPNPVTPAELGSLWLYPTLNGETPKCDSWYNAPNNHSDVSVTVAGDTGLPVCSAYLQESFDDSFNVGFKVYLTSELSAGSYSMTFPAGFFYTVDLDSGAHIYQNNYKMVFFKVVDGQGGETDPGFLPKSVNPDPKYVVDPSIIDWTVTLTFDQKVYLNSDIKPYLELDGVKYMTDNFFWPGQWSSINANQASASFWGMNERPNGTYKFVFPAGAVSYADGSTNKEYTVNYVWEGSKKEGGETGEVKLTSLYIGDFDLLKPNQVLPNIPNKECYIRVGVEPESIQGVVVKIMDVTGISPDKYATTWNDALWTNEIEFRTGSVFSKEIYSIDGLKLYKEKTYVVEVQLYNMTQPISGLVATLYSETFTGETEAFKFSPAEIVSISPEPGTEFTVNDELVVTFSQPVNLNANYGYSGFHNGNAGFEAFSNIKSNEDQTVWTIKFKAASIAEAGGPNQICPCIAGTDMNGLTLRPAKYDVEPAEGVYVYNQGFEALSYTQIDYAGYAKCANLIVSPLEAETIEYLDFSIEGRQPINPSYMVLFPQVKNAAGEVVAQVLVDNYVDEENPDEGGHIIVLDGTTGTDATVYEIRVPLSHPLTEAGVYTVELEWNLFVAGTELTSKASAPQLVTLIVGPQKPANEKLTFTGNNVEDLDMTYVPGDEEEGIPGHYMISVETKNDVAEITVNIPEGYDGMYYKELNPGGWKRISGAELEADDWTKGNVIRVEADGATHMIMTVLAQGDEIDMATGTQLMVTVDKTTGVSEFEAETEAPVYFTVDGVQVANPEKGLFIKVINGKASKVVL